MWKMPYEVSLWRKIKVTSSRVLAITFILHIFRQCSTQTSLELCRYVSHGCPKQLRNKDMKLKNKAYKNKSKIYIAMTQCLDTLKKEKRGKNVHKNFERSKKAMSVQKCHFPLFSTVCCTLQPLVFPCSALHAVIDIVEKEDGSSREQTSSEDKCSKISY